MASGTPVSRIVKYADSVQICLSKGLGCPVGSVIVGTEEFIQKARKNRKVVGGGMRQASIIAAPGIYALNNMIDRLAEDHEHAKMIEEALLKIPNLKVKDVDTNIIIIDLTSSKWTPEGIIEAFKEKGILVAKIPGIQPMVRLVTYFGITRENIEKVVEIIPEIFK